MVSNRDIALEQAEIDAAAIAEMIWLMETGAL